MPFVTMALPHERVEAWSRRPRCRSHSAGRWLRTMEKLIDDEKETCKEMLLGCRTPYRRLFCKATPSCMSGYHGLAAFPTAQPKKTVLCKRNSRHAASTFPSPRLVVDRTREEGGNKNLLFLLHAGYTLRRRELIVQRNVPQARKVRSIERNRRRRPIRLASHLHVVASATGGERAVREAEANVVRTEVLLLEAARSATDREPTAAPKTKSPRLLALTQTKGEEAARRMDQREGKAAYAFWGRPPNVIMVSSSREG